MRRLAELMGAMLEVAEVYPELEVWASSSPPPFTVRARLQSDLHAGTEMWITPWGAHMRTWPRRGEASGDTSYDERDLRLSLRNGYEWEDLVMPNAHVFARVLLQRMQGEQTWNREATHDSSH